VDVLEVRRLWIKAAIEHRVVRLEYRDEGLNGDVTVREVEPDHVRDLGPLSRLVPRTYRLWGVPSGDREGGPCCFRPADVVHLELMDETFEPRPDGRWMEHLREYHDAGLRDEGVPPA
jgi:hypothetical protein